MVTSREQFSQALSELKDRSPHSYRTLALSIDSNVSTLQGWCTGKHLPYAREREKFDDLLRALGVVDTTDWHDSLVALRRRGSSDNPYLGLRSYDVGDAARFHGRGEQTSDIVDRLNAASTAPTSPTASIPMIVIGPSGSGKTSLLRAGVIAQLRSQAQVESLHITPSDTPMAVCDDIDRWVQQHPSTQRIIVVDQFEEIYSGAAKTDPADFIERLRQLATDPLTQIVVSVRNDFYAQVSLNDWLHTGLVERQVIVGPLTRAQAAECITLPARHAGLEIADDLLVELVNRFTRHTDLEPTTEALPLLSHLLFQLAEPGHRTLTMAHYNAAGGLNDTIANVAETAYSELDDDDQATCREVLLRLVGVGQGTSTTRRTVNVAAIDVTSAAGTDHVIDVFTSHRLLILDDNKLTISHEALLTGWPRLLDWIDDVQSKFTTARRLAAAGRAWRNTGCDDGALLRGSLLDEAIELADLGGRTWLGDELVDYVEQSRLAHAEQVRNNAAVIGRQLALQATIVAATDQSVGAQIAVLAHRTADTVATRSALFGATAPAPGTRRLGAAGEVWIGSAADTHRIAANSGGHRRINVYDTADSLRLIVSVGQETGERITAVAISPDGSCLAHFAAGDGVRITALSDEISSAEASDRVPTLDADPNSVVHSLQFDRSGTLLFSGGASATVGVWDATTGTLLDTLHASAGVASLSVTDDAGTVAVAAVDGSVTVWQSSDGGFRLAWAADHVWTDPASSVTIAPDGRFLVAGSHNGRLRVWMRPEEHTGPWAANELTLTSAPFSSWVNDIALSPTGTTIAAAGSDGLVRFWNTTTWQEMRPELRHASVVTSVHFINSTEIVTATEDGTLRTWQLPEAMSAGTDSTIWSISLDSAGSHMLTASGGRCATWNIEPDGSRVLENVLTLEPGLVASGVGRLTNDGAHAAIATRTGQVCWGAPGQMLETLDGPSDMLVEAVEIAPDDSFVAAIDAAGHASFWHLDDLTTRVDIEVPVRPLDIAINSIGNLTAIVTDTHDLVLVDTTDPLTPNVLSTTRVADSFAMSVEFHPTADIVAVGAADRSVSLWDCASHASPQLVHRVTGLGGHVVGVAFDRTGTRLAAAVTDTRVWIWDVSTIGGPDITEPELVASIRTPGAAAYSVRFSDGGSRLFGAGPNQEIFTWTLDPKAAIALIEAHQGDTLTLDEWVKLVPDSVPGAPSA